MKKNKIIYWVLTALVLLPTGLSGIPELFMGGPESVVKSMQTLGYPLYLMKILGFAKIAGALTIIFGNRWPRLKEWAYAGFAIDFLGALASHILANDAANAPAPAIMFILLMGSYFYWHKTTETQTA